MRARRLVVLVLAAIGAVVLLRRRATELVDVQFEDGAGMRLTRGVEARDLLEDATAIVEIAG